VMQTAVAPYISYSINADDVSAAKPDHKMFQVIAQRANLNASQCLYIGDDAGVDVIGASNADWDCIWLNRDNNPWAEKHGREAKTIQSLVEL